MNLKSEKRKLFFLMKNYNFSQRLNDLSLYIDILICKYDDIQSNTFLNDFFALFNILSVICLYHFSFFIFVGASPFFSRFCIEWFSYGIAILFFLP